MNNKRMYKSGDSQDSLFFFIEPITDVEKFRRNYAKFDNYFLNLFYKCYLKILDTFGRIYITKNNYYLNLLHIYYINLFSKLGIEYKKSYNYRLCLLGGKFVNGIWDSDYVIDIHLTMRLKIDSSVFRIYNEKVFKRLKANLYDLDTAYNEFKKNFIILDVYKVDKKYSFNIDCPSLYEIDSDDCELCAVTPRIYEEHEYLCCIFFDYFRRTDNI